MQAKMMKAPAQPAPATPFEWVPPPAVPFRATEETDCERLKRQAMSEWLNRAETVEELALIRRAANEAAAMAWLTPYPLLVLPLLVEEKADRAVFQAKRQQQIRERSRFLMAQPA
jgi:hypothetical protein